jgi:hypothetical protein
MSTMTQMMEPEVTARVHEKPLVIHPPVALQADHALPTEEQITRVLFMIIMAASVLFIGATLFVTHM